MTDEQLLANAAQAEKDGVSSEKNQYTALLIAKYIPLIKAKANCFENARAEKDDLISEGFLGLLNAIRSYNPQKGVFAAFASTCITNKMRSLIAKNSNSPVEMSLDDSVIDEIKDQNPAAEDIIILKEENNEMLKQVEELLSPREREVFYLYLSAYSYSQIAEKLNISVKAVDNAITRAKAKLRDSFQ